MALMLGRLRMSVDACIAAYTKLAKDAFKPQQSRQGMPLYKADNLVSAIKHIIRGSDHNADSLLTDRRDDATRTAVVATLEITAGSSAQLFRSYAGGTGSTRDCKIWEAARATTAASGFFESITINQIPYIDGGMGLNNNPGELSLSEAKEIWPNHEIGVLVSLGTGTQRPIDVSITI